MAAAGAVGRQKRRKRRDATEIARRESLFLERTAYRAISSLWFYILAHMRDHRRTWERAAPSVTDVVVQ